MSIYIVLYLLSVHWIADFVMQSNWMAINKSKRWDALAYHVLVYTAVLTAAAQFIMPLAAAMCFPLINGALHFVTDAVTSRVTSALYARNQRHWFFVMIGFDQLLHHAALLLTYQLIVGANQ